MNQAICLIRPRFAKTPLYIRVMGEALRDRTTKIFLMRKNFASFGDRDILFLVVRPVRTTHQAAPGVERI